MAFGRMAAAAVVDAIDVVVSESFERMPLNVPVNDSADVATAVDFDTVPHYCSSLPLPGQPENSVSIGWGNQ